MKRCSLPKAAAVLLAVLMPLLAQRSEAYAQGEETEVRQTETYVQEAETEAQQMEAYAQGEETEARQTETGTLQDGQRTAVIRVVSITGNELTYYEAEEDGEASAPEKESETEKTPQPETESETAPQTEKTPQPETESETAQQAESETKTAPQVENFEPGQMPDRAELPDRAQMPDGAELTDEGNMPGQPPERAKMKTVYLPVAVAVHTDTDEVRTFSILAAGDELEVLFEETDDGEEMITEIWIKGVED